MHAEPDPRRWKALAILVTAFFMVILDASIVIVGLPTIQADLGFNEQDLQWVLSAYALTFGGLLLLGGRAADLLGRKRMFMIGTALFTLASLACGLAWSDTSLIGFRAFQGVAAAIMTPTALSILMVTFREGAERNKALGIWGSLGGVGATAGWLIGGPLTDGLGWEWLFFINIPVGIAVLALAPGLLSESRDTGRVRNFDVPGAITITAALAALVYAVVEAPDAGWGSAQTIGILAGALVLIGIFVAIESRAEAPLLPLSILKNRTLVGGNATMLFLGMGAFGAPFILTLYAQQVLGYSAVRFGLTSLIFPVMAAVGSITGQAIVTKSGPRPIAVGGMTLAVIGAVVWSFVSVNGTYFADIFFGLFFFGLGLGATFVACSIAALTGVREQDAGLASGLNNTAFQIGGALGVAILSTIAVTRTENLLAAGNTDQLVALTDGFQLAFVGGVIVVAIGALVALITLRRSRADTAPAGQVEPVPVIE